MRLRKEGATVTRRGDEPAGVHEERQFLSGPQRREVEVVRAFRVFPESIRGLRKLHFVGAGVTVFGSARFGEGHPNDRLRMTSTSYPLTTPMGFMRQTFFAIPAPSSTSTTSATSL